MNKILDNSKIWFRNNWIYLIIFVLVFSLRICALHNKATFFVDDVASFICSTPNNKLEGAKFKYYIEDLRMPAGVDYSGRTVRKALFESKSDIKSIFEDLISLRNKNYDASHTSLYY